MDLSFWTCVQALVVLMYLVVLIKKGFSIDNIVRYGIPMFFNMAAYAAENEYKLLSGGMLHEVSYSILYLTLCAESVFFLTKIVAEKGIGRIEKNVITYGLALSGILWSISSYIPLEETMTSPDRGAYVEHLGYFNNAGLANSIASTSEFLNDEDMVFSTYASGVEAYRNQFQPSGTDYIIHVLGNDARSKYLESFHKSGTNYVATIRETYADWEYWAKNANWFFYRELYQNYIPAYANDYELFWKKKENITSYDLNQTNFSVEYIDESNIKISVEAPGVTFGEADVSLTYKVKKNPCKRSLFTFNTMVYVDNGNASNLSGNDHDKFYYLAKEGDGTPNTAIGIPIINGAGSVTLTSEPEKNTRFENFDAQLMCVDSSGYFDSVVVTNCEMNGNQARLTLMNTPENQKITENALGIKIGEQNYQAQFCTSDDGSAINIDSQSLDEDAIRQLIGHSYYPVIQVVRADYPHVYPLSDDNWEQGISKSDSRLLLFENDPVLLDQLSNAVAIDSGTMEYTISSVEEDGQWIHVTVDKDASNLAFPSKLVIR